MVTVIIGYVVGEVQASQVPRDGRLLQPPPEDHESPAVCQEERGGAEPCAL